MLITERYSNKINGVISCFDRVVIQGVILGWCYSHGNMQSEKIGKESFEIQMERANVSSSSPEIATPALLEKDRKDTILYILMDGSVVNTRIEDKDGSTWKELKLGLTFLDKDVIKRKNDSAIITKKEYVTYLGSVNEFKKALFDSAARVGYGKVKKVVVIGDGTHWIWNMCKELFSDAEYILDFYHMTENVYDYAKELFFNGALMGLNIWPS